MNDNRNHTIDILRGIAVVGVLLGHAIQRSLIVNYENNIVFKMIYSFHMPLFIILSGYTLNEYTKAYNKNFIKKKVLGLFVPMVVWSFIVYFMRNFNFVGIKEFISFPESFLEYIKTLFLHPDIIFWFLYVVFWYDMIFYIVHKLNLKSYKMYAFLLCLYILLYSIPHQYFGISRLRGYFPLFVLGYYISKRKKLLNYLKYFLPIAIILYVMLFNNFNVTIDNIIIYYIISISANIILYCLVRYVLIKLVKIKISLKYIGFLGQHSLEMYLIQCICLNIGIGNGIIKTVTIFAAALTISLFACFIFNKSRILRLILFGKE